MGIKDWFRRARPKNEESNADEPAPQLQTEAAAEAEDALNADEIIAAEPAPRLNDMDFTGFWHDTRESERRHICPPPDFRAVREAEEALGVKLPASYVELMKKHNGGLVSRCWFPTRTPAKGFSDYIQITDILGIGKDAPYSLLGRFGSRFLTESYGHNPEIGIAICNTIRAGHALVMLDYRKCGVRGEPEVLYSNADTREETTIAPDFETFLRGLTTSSAIY